MVSRALTRTKDAGQTMLAALGLSDGAIMIMVVVTVVTLFLAWVVSSDARTRRLSSLIRSRRAGARR
ncbi:hypothetical protein FraQA3DRAFT_0762 [Frankia sp. QA3]|nr:hypothetical protein FraQA3DRAFT_0762 [Frankia sp. QA3]